MNSDILRTIKKIVSDRQMNVSGADERQMNVSKLTSKSWYEMANIA